MAGVIEEWLDWGDGEFFLWVFFMACIFVYPFTLLLVLVHVLLSYEMHDNR